MTEAELQKRMAEYNVRVVDEIVSLFERPRMPQPRRSHYTLSDEDREREHKALRKLKELDAAYELAVRLEVLPLTELRKEHVSDDLTARGEDNPGFYERWANAIDERE